MIDRCIILTLVFVSYLNYIIYNIKFIFETRRSQSLLIFDREKVRWYGRYCRWFIIIPLLSMSIIWINILLRL